ncbi:L-threonine ammonia-lyase-like [Sycon ciliatum]|uniref:L-threonine ammonia-lyase-like n=1 Tax=Sycon ciliatum TaxID=27933 RepID=UPI0020ADE83D|eukprot:scpid36092/ scgid20945/ Probable serine racemase; D-serine ammonia-lyase; D-serine dehydratase; L-serine ammonia-lyase; L-serine dehydratase
MDLNVSSLAPGVAGAGIFDVFKPPSQSPKPAFELPLLQDVQKAQQVLKENGVVRTRVVHLKTDTYLMKDVDECGGPKKIDIYLKLENEQKCGTFKTRGAVNYVAGLDPEVLKQGIVTPSVGSFGQALAMIKNDNPFIPFCAALLPQDLHIYRSQLLENMGAQVHRLPFPSWWFALESRTVPPTFPIDSPLHKAHFIHPATTACSAGDATIALEILEDLPDVDAIVVPFCTGGFSSGVSHLLKQVNSSAKLYAAEVSSSTPLRTAMNAGTPSRCNHTPSFVDQIGGENVLPDMWNSIKASGIKDSLVVSPEQVVNAIQMMLNGLNVVSEGAGAVTLAAALSGQAGAGKICCVITGGNIDPDFLTKAMHGEVPMPRFH